MSTTTLGLAIGWKFDHQDGMQTIDGKITKFPGGIPSDEDQAKWVKEYEDHLAATEYQDVRRAAYPEIGDQLDALWKGGDAQAAMKVIVDKVKSDNPKP